MFHSLYKEIVCASRMEQFGGLEADDVQRVRDLAREELTAMRVMVSTQGG